MHILYSYDRETWTMSPPSARDSLHHTTHLISPPPRVPSPNPITSKERPNPVYRETLRSDQHTIRHATQSTPSRSIDRPLFVPSLIQNPQTKTLVSDCIHNSFPHSYFLYQYSLTHSPVSFCHYVITRHVLVPPFVVCLLLTSVSVLLSLYLSVSFSIPFLFVLYIKVTARTTLLSLIPLPFCLPRCVSKQFHIYLSVYLSFSLVARRGLEGKENNEKKKKH
ncbi:hypothetical protein BDV37DRAFT_113702 [Aspergillus pseudonomiae]|uniref:Uncharacterized protein n=1 Tax=Aspergillus pseudonomiae TaxID=1506151 RepID=A0A5N7DFQ9_9EURO|nr:uncharacterized protein BDV37DRAFT_113702 [Aspergillus pseudonomiae]KAE8404488.1 hypothetical protein BDV37DRAFT_113702 [Aspergillus pseudonomiae]